MALDDWEQLKAESLHRGTATMQLNQLADPGGGGGGNSQVDLTLNFPDSAAIGDAAVRLSTRMDRESDHARISSMKTASGLTSGFAVGKALNHVAERWVDQVVLPRCLRPHLKGQLESLATIWAAANPGQTKNNSYTLTNEINAAAFDGNARARGLAGDQ
ncbi:hypothetical protein WDA79_20370 [Streptomyces sp. A475]|uniref:hypothetical protein n=1 Tax=Streptomyces sp. A475 TaxID=3131976 RepID=UPI0030C968BF